MQHDFIKLARDMRRAHALGRSFRFPAMTMRDLGRLAVLLDDVPAVSLINSHTFGNQP